MSVAATIAASQPVQSVETYDISLVVNERDNQPKRKTVSWGQLLAMFETPKRSPCTVETCGKGEHNRAKPGAKPECKNKYGPGWIPATFATGRRKKEDVESVQLLVVDADKLPDQAALEDTLARLAHLRYFAHASHSDGVAVVGGKRCARIVIPLSQPVSGEDWPRFWPAAMHALGMPADEATKDASRLYFLPARPSDADYFYVAHDGEPLDVIEIAKTAAKARAASLNDELKRALAEYAYGDEHQARAVARSPVVADYESMVKRLRAYLAKMEPSIQGQNGSVKLFEACCRLMHGLGPHSVDDTTVRQLIDEEFNPRCQPAWSSREIDHKIKDARECKSPEIWRIEDREPARRHYDANGGPLAEIIVNDELHVVVDQAIDALAQRGGVFVRGRALVEVVRDRSVSHGLTYPEGSPVIHTIRAPRLLELLASAARWSKPTRDGVRPCKPPDDINKAALARGEWPQLHVLDGVTDAPILHADGSIHDEAGYDSVSRTIYAPGSVRWPAVPESPTRDDARQAYDELTEPTCDVPFDADTDRAAWASLVLTLVARAAIGPDTCTPMYLVRAPIRGAGKSLLVDLAAVVATGRRAPKRPPSTTEDELRKAMLAYALESPSLVVIDNVEGVIGSATLAQIVTAGVLNDRLLGASESRTLPIRFVLAATGNNMQLRGDLGRRVVPIDIDPRVEHPEDRDGWRYPNVLEHVARERPRLVAAALTILRGYVVAGRPSHGRPAYGSFEAWDGLVRGAVTWASGVDPLAGIERIREDGDEDADRLRALIFAWQGALGDLPLLLADVIKRAGERGELHDALASYCRDGRLDPKQIGHALRKLKGRICDGLEIVSMPGRAGSKRWAVRQVQQTLSLPADLVDVPPEPSEPF